MNVGEERWDGGGCTGRLRMLPAPTEPCSCCMTEVVRHEPVILASVAFDTLLRVVSSHRKFETHQARTIRTSIIHFPFSGAASRSNQFTVVSTTHEARGTTLAPDRTGPHRTAPHRRHLSDSGNTGIFQVLDKCWIASARRRCVVGGKCTHTVADLSGDDTVRWLRL